MSNSIPENISISKSEDNTKTIVTIKPRKRNGYDIFFLIFFVFGLGFLTTGLIINRFDFTSMVAGIIFLGLFGKLIIEMSFSLLETHVISFDKNQLEISRKKSFRSKSRLINLKAFKSAKLEKVGVIADFSEIFLGFKNIIALFGYQIPIISIDNEKISIAEHHDENIRKWIANYLSKKL